MNRVQGMHSMRDILGSTLPVLAVTLCTPAAVAACNAIWHTQGAHSTRHYYLYQTHTSNNQHQNRYGFQRQHYKAAN